MENVVVFLSDGRKVCFPNYAVLNCAVSGGADSLALAILASKTGLPVTLHHVDHGLREGSQKEAALVEAAAVRLGCDFVSHQVQVIPPNVEDKARRARYAVLPERVLTGHTMDDQAESFLLAMGRGSGLAGLVGIDPTHRPLLVLRRKDTELICTEAGFEWFTDPTNCSAEYRRNRVRLELVPLLNDIFQRDVVPVITGAQETLKEDNDFLEGLASKIAVNEQRNFQTVPNSILSRVVRAHLKELGLSYTRQYINKLMAVLRGELKGTDFGHYYFTKKGGVLVTKQHTNLNS